LKKAVIEDVKEARESVVVGEDVMKASSVVASGSAP
jgi:hypothetical protein